MNNKCEVVSVKKQDIKTEKKAEKQSWLTKINLALSSNKLLQVKGGKFVMPLILIAVVLIIYLNLTSSTTANTSASTSESSVSFTSGLDYISKIETKLQNVLGSIKNAGKTSVMISIDSSPELTIATNSEEKTVTTSSGSTTTIITEPIIVNKNGESSPLVLMETLPEIKGVIVVSEGASDVNVKLNIITAVKALLGIPSSAIEVFTGI